MANIKEIKYVYEKFKKNRVPLVLMHCISSYPNKIENSYLSNINFLKKNFNCEIGLSDHSNGIEIPIYSSFLGIRYIEKHFKIDNSHKCVDAPVSITRDQFKQLRNKLKEVNKIIGKPKFGVRPEEKNAIIFKRKKMY